MPRVPTRARLAEYKNGADSPTRHRPARPTPTATATTIWSSLYSANKKACEVCDELLRIVKDMQVDMSLRHFCCLKSRRIPVSDMSYRFSLTRVIGQEVEACVRINHHSFRKNKAAAFPLLLFSPPKHANKQTTAKQPPTDRSTKPIIILIALSPSCCLSLSLFLSQRQADRDTTCSVRDRKNTNHTFQESH